MKCHILFSEKNKKNISKCRLLKILPRVLSVNNPKCWDRQVLVNSEDLDQKLLNTPLLIRLYTAYHSNIKDASRCS